MRKILFLHIFLLIINVLHGQEITDSLLSTTDSLKIDSIKAPSGPKPIESTIKFSANDSMYFNMSKKKMYLFGQTSLKTNDINLSSAILNIDLDKQELTAEGIKDSTGLTEGKPQYKDKSQEFTAGFIMYNFKSKQGYVKDIITEESGGYLHGSIVKMHRNKESHILAGKFTTCDLEHPHFYIEMTKAKVIPGDKIISGPFYFVILDVPIYFLGLPFGYFPSQRKVRSGLLTPTYGEELRRGFFLRDFGYYWAISDYVDLALKGEYYTLGSWGVRALSNFRRKYWYNGRINFRYGYNQEGEKGTIDYKQTNSYTFGLNFNLDPKAIPNTTFIANISFDKGNYGKYNARNINQYVRNTSTSSISYSKSWPGTPFNFSANMNMIQNMQDSTIDLRMPIITFNMARVFPFKRKIKAGKTRWYEKIGVSMNSNFTNNIPTFPDSLLFMKEIFERMQNGFKYSVPVSGSFKILKYINISPTLNYTGRIYSTYIERYNVLLSDLYPDRDTTGWTTTTDTIHKITHNLEYSFSVPLSTKLYGLFNINGKKIKAIRHVMTPSMSFMYRPDFVEDKWNYYALYPNDYEQKRYYSIYEGAIFGYPGQGEIKALNFNLANSFEMKMKTKKDTAADAFTKIKLLNSLRFNMSYNFAADSMKLSPMSFSGNTRLLKSVTLNFGGTFDPYVYDSTTNVAINKYLFTETNFKKWAVLRRARMTVQFDLNSKMFGAESKKDTETKKNKDLAPVKDVFSDNYIDEDQYDYFDVKWGFRVGYTLSYSNVLGVSKYVQNLRVSGNISLTDKWRINVASGYDFQAKKLTSTRISVYRDLHCWEMSFNVIPFGTLRSYSFRINIKSGLFEGVEFKREKSWHDN